MKKIDGSPKNLKQLLQNTKYSIHYYQREYMWQRKHVEELIDDLTSEFLEFYKPEDDRPAVADYGVYFMGSIVLAGRENAIIDGQQRFSSLTLLLMYLNNRLKKIGHSCSMIESMIFSESYGSKSFNINVEERYECMNAIFEDKPFDISASGESVKNLYERYNDICEIFPEEITDDMLLHFGDWLAERVFFIEIVASTEQDAHRVFITMNDRGLSLTSTEMLKGYLLAEISDDKKREELNGVWKNKILELKNDDDKGDEVFIKTWLRAQYAETIRETKAGAINKDFDIIGGPFHKWVHEEKDKLGLKTSEDYVSFIKKFENYANIYLGIKKAETTYSEETKYVYYNAKLNFTLQPQLLLACICDNDNKDIIIKKINLVARFIDLLINSRVTKNKSVDYSTIKNYVFNVTKDIRRTSIDTLKIKLENQYQNLNYNAKAVIPSFGLNSFTKKYIKNILARITGYLEEQTGVPSKYVDYMDTQTNNPFEVEHIIANHFEWFTDEYADLEDFKKWRNSIGALLLLRKSINASLNDKKFDYKIEKYCSSDGNIYTNSLGEIKNNPRFDKFKKTNNLDFKPYTKFGKNEIEERNRLVINLIEFIWNDRMFVE